LHVTFTILMIDEVLKSLSALPHRCSTTANERRAGEYLRQKMEDLGIDVQLSPFVAPTTFSWIYFILYFGFILSAVVGAYLSILGFIIAVMFAVLFYGEQTTRFSPLSQWVPEGLSHNVIGRIPAPDRVKNTLVLVAHYDTSKASLLFHPRLTPRLRRSYLVSLVMIGLIIVGSAGRIIAPAGVDRVINWALVVPGLYLAVLCLGMIERELRRAFVNGAADNASGVAVALELAKRIQGQGGLPGWEVVVLLTGSEETGLGGMKSFLAEAEKRLSRETTVFMNFDNLGGGRLHYLQGEGMLFGLPSDPELLKIADGLVKSDPRFGGVGSRPFNALTLDTLVPRTQGYRVFSLMGLTEAGVPYPWHWYNDTLENLDRALTQLAAEFGWEVVSRLASPALHENHGA